MKNNLKSVTEWKKLVEEFQKPHRGRALWQCVNTLGPILGIWIALYFLFTLFLCIHPPGCTRGIIFGAGLYYLSRDCGHGSFFKSKKRPTMHWVSLPACSPSPLSSLEVGTRGPSRNQWRSRTSVELACLDHDGGGIPYLLP